MLVYAAEANKIRVVELLLKQTELDVNAVDSQLNTALVYSAWKGNDEIVSMLLQHPNVEVDFRGCKTAGELLRDANKKVAPHHLTTTGLTRLFMALCALAQYDQWSRTDLRGPLPVTWQVLTDEQKQLYKRCSRLVIEE